MFIISEAYSFDMPGFGGHLSTPDKDISVKLQSGEFWEFSCSTKLEGEVGDDFIVIEETNNNTFIEEAAPIEFTLDVMCCDPAEADCKQCGSTDDLIPIIKIGPNSQADSS